MFFDSLKAPISDTSFSRTASLSFESLEVVHLALVYILETDHYSLDELFFIERGDVAFSDRLGQIRSRCQLWMVTFDELHSVFFRFSCRCNE